MPMRGNGDQAGAAGAAGAGRPGSFGIIITNRDRPLPGGPWLESLAVQHAPPPWVLLSDLGSGPGERAELRALADRYGVSYLRIDHEAAWNKSLAFNTALRAALLGLPAVSHIIQLDADMILHPLLLARASAEVRAVSSFWCAPRLAPRDLRTWATPGDQAAYAEMIAQCGPVMHFAIGTFLALPCDWLVSQRGFDEAFTGWGHEDTELWWRVRRSLTHAEDTSGTMLIHQWHAQQPNAGKRGQNWPLFMQRIANPATAANPAGWGEGPVAESVLRPGIIPRT